MRVVTTSGGVTVASNDDVVVINKSATETTAVTLSTSPVTGRVHVIKDGKGNSAAQNITISAASGNIDGASSVVLNVNYSSITVIYDGTEWRVI